MATCSDYNEENDAGKEEGGVIPDVEEKIKTPPNSPAREMPCSSSSSNVTTPRDKGARSRSTTSGRLLTPNPDGDDPDDFIDEAEMLPKIYVSNKSYSYEERASLYCDEMIGPFSVRLNANANLCKGAKSAHFIENANTYFANNN